jgi:hypothetical protein
MVDATPCAWCRRPLPQARATGRPRVYCRASCRQRAFEQRRRLTELGLSESELVVTRADLDAVRDAVFVLEAAIQDVDADLAASSTPADLRAALDWLLAAARPLVALRVDADHVAPENG